MQENPVATWTPNSCPKELELGSLVPVGTLRYMLGC